ncbi:MAG: PAS domain S-box protein, partial [Humidesulfovibrio sp.]|nr:PAS domain S-box protein [Humidesulfovibrio sp.]
MLTVLVQPASAGYTPDPHGPQSITVVSDDNYPPYIFRGANGEIQGILVDEWRAWERKTGITVILKAMDWEKAQEAMNRGEADVIDTIFYTEERAKIYDFSKAYARLDVPVFTHVDLGGIVDPPSMRGFTIGVKSGDACIDILKQYGIDTFKEYDSYQDVILAAKRHDIRVFCVDKPPALYYLYKYGIDTEYRSSFVLYTGEFHRAVKKGRTALLRTVEDGFAAISPREHKAIEDKWLGTPLVVREYLQWLIIAGLSIAAVMLALFGFNLILRRQIRTRTAALAESLRNLCKSEDRFRAIFDSVSDCIFIHDTVDGSILEVNDRTCATFGYSRDEFRQLDVGSISSGEAPYTQEEAVRRIQQTVQGQILTFEWHCRKKGGHLFWAGVSTSKATLGGDERVLVTLHDVTERKRAEEALHENQRLLESILNTVPLSIFWQDRNCVFLGCNAAFARSLGKSGPQEIIGKTDFDLPVPYEQSVAHRADDLHVMSTLTPKLHYMEPLTQEDGEHIWLETSKLPLLDDTGQAVGLLGMFENVTDRVNSVDRLKQSEERFSRLFRLSPEAIMLIDATTKKIVDANEAFSSLTGYNLSETLGRDTLELGIYADPANREEFYRLQPRDGHVENMEFEGRRKDGQGFICSLSAQAMEIGSKQYILVMLRNVTELKKMQEMMIQTEKMISIGGIAAGIAHEINNPLGIVLQAAQNLVQRTRPDFKKNMDVAAKLGFD